MTRLHGLRSDRLEALQRESAALSGSVKGRTDLIANFLTEAASLQGKVEEWPRIFAGAAGIDDPAARTVALEAAAGGLHAIANNAQEPFLLRFLAARALGYFAARIDRDDNPPWVQKIPRLLDSADARSRLVGALLAANGGLRREQALEKGRVIPELIGGLRGETFAERYYSYTGLVELTALCNAGRCCLR